MKRAETVYCIFLVRAHLHSLFHHNHVLIIYITPYYPYSPSYPTIQPTLPLWLDDPRESLLSHGTNQSQPPQTPPVQYRLLRTIRDAGTIG